MVGFLYDCSGEVFSATVDLPVGEYLYKYIVDDKWVVNKNQVGDRACAD